MAVVKQPIIAVNKSFIIITVAIIVQGGIRSEGSLLVPVNYSFEPSCSVTARNPNDDGKPGPVVTHEVGLPR